MDPQNIALPHRPEFETLCNLSSNLWKAAWLFGTGFGRFALCFLFDCSVSRHFLLPFPHLDLWLSYVVSSLAVPLAIQAWVTKS
jgi:hypothetical protein